VIALSVVVPTYCGAERLPATLDALVRLPRPERGVEVLVVDDGSPVPPAAIVESCGGGIARLIVLGANRGRAAARNAGLASARGEIILFLDDDMTLAGDALRGHADAHADERETAALGRVQPDPASFRGRFGRFLARQDEERDRRWAGGAEPGFEAFLSGHFSIRAATARRVGGFDESFQGYGFEDSEFGLRLRDAGVRFVYRRDLASIHRSAHVAFDAHCRRHLEVGAMGHVLAARHPTPEVLAYLRLEGTRWKRGDGSFRAALAAADAAVRHTPAPLRAALLAAARSATRGAALVLPERALHALYHVVRDMHYRAGVLAASG